MEKDNMAPRASSRREDSAALAEAREIPLERIGGDPIEIDGEKFIVGKLSINQIAAVARLALKSLTRMNIEKRQELVRIAREQAQAEETGDEIGKVRAAQEAAALAPGNVEILMTILDDQIIDEVFATVLHVDTEWVGEHVGALEAIEIIEALLKHNNAQQVYAAFLRLTRLFRNSQEKE